MKDYLRIGTDYFKIVNKPDIHGNTYKTIIPWRRQTIVDDYGRSSLKKIKKYEGFTVKPAHNGYKPTIKNFYNRYNPLSHELKPDVDTNAFPYTREFLIHIFGKQYDLGLDYLTILWQFPTQILPILCLVSEERNTGKTTFLNWLKLVFEDNMTINKNEDFRSRFNSDWSEKLIIAIDEVLLDRREDSERIKNLSTAAVYKTESKGKDKIETPFFGKFILCSNNEKNFIFIDEKEIRYWVRKIPVLMEADPHFYDKLQKELISFVSYIATRKIKTPKKTRMWFTKEQIKTDALDVLIKGTKYSLEKELVLLLKELFEDFEQTELCYSLSNLLEFFKQSGQRTTRRELSQIINDKWKLHSKNSSYTWYRRFLQPEMSEWTIQATTVKGRFFTFRKEFIDTL